MTIQELEEQVKALQEEIEIWKTIDINKNYEISNYGRVRNKNRYILKQHVGTHGYCQVNLDFDGKNKSKKTHRLVAQAFIPNIENKPQVNHIDGDKTNNNVNNLEWCTNSENQKHAFEIGLKEKSRKASSKNIKVVQKIAWSKNKKPIAQISLEGLLVREFGSAKEAEEFYKINGLCKYISMCCNGKINKTHGYVWRFIL